MGWMVLLVSWLKYNNFFGVVAALIASFLHLLLAFIISTFSQCTIQLYFLPLPFKFLLIYRLINIIF